MPDVGRSRLFAIGEVLLVTGAYIAISLGFVSAVDFAGIMPELLVERERIVGGVFLAGAAIQLALVLAAAYLLRLEAMAAAIRNAFKPATRSAWSIALIASAIHVATGAFAVLGEPAILFEPSWRNAILSVAPAPDGWTQEIVFRGYVILRLARAGIAPAVQVLLSGALFAGIHIGYAGEGVWQFLFPLIGTFALGSFFAWAVQKGDGSLKPVILCHVAIIVLLQPWLSLAR